MDNNLASIKEKRVQKIINNLEKNNMKGYFVKDTEELKETLQNLLNEGDTVGIGGSMTIFETGVLEFLRNGNYNLLDRYKEGNTPDDIKELYRKAFFANAYVTSTNSLTEKGELFNVDGNGNRVAAMAWGPDKVIVICGTNKIVKDEHAALERNKTIAAPANATRLSLDTPCKELGYCVECSHPQRICCTYVTIKKQRVKDRINVIIVDGEFGY
jgi:L-lactate utilization protein LutB